MIAQHGPETYDRQENQRLGDLFRRGLRFVLHMMSQSGRVTPGGTPPENNRTGRSPTPAHSDPVQIVRDYLSAMEARELDQARAMLGHGFVMTFPGGACMTTLEELIAWSKPRYRQVGKTYDGFDAIPADGDAAIVYCHGTLHGTYHDGSSFQGIRFIDRFELVDGKITKQDVWNDMAEKRATA